MLKASIELYNINCFVTFTKRSIKTQYTMCIVNEFTTLNQFMLYIHISILFVSDVAKTQRYVFYLLIVTVTKT